ncbi:MAG: transglutaminase-like domain-containing protein [Actinomycetaceae bacterium]|nr:transglutaminase-like domain-containing protein [Actinomycetaceae bacterium]
MVDSARRLRPSLSLLTDVLLVLGLLITIALPWGGLFIGPIGYISALSGVAVGAVAAIICTYWRLRIPAGLALFFLLHLLIGGLAGLPMTQGWLSGQPATTIRLLVTTLLSGWKNLLTVEAPVVPKDGLSLVPFIACEIAAFTALVLILRARRPITALLPALALLLLGLLWGSQEAPFALACAVIGAVLAFTVAVRLASVGMGRRDEAIHIEKAPGRKKIPFIASAVILIVISLLSAWGAWNFLPTQNRFALRDHIDPPLDLKEYSSPVVEFRKWTTKDADKAMVEVEGMPADARLRLAALDSYNGTIFGIAETTPGSEFTNVGVEFTEDAPPVDASSTMSVSILAYSGHWIPTGERTYSLRYLSARQQVLGDAVHYSSGLGTILSTQRLVEGDQFQAVVTHHPKVSDTVLAETPIAKVPLPDDTNVPEAISTKARELTEGKTPGFDQVRSIARALSTDGFYSDGSDGLSRPGHRSDRLERFLTDEAMVGDDDQYAPAMALMLRSLGIPSRIAIGFRNDAEAAQTRRFTGDDVHMWVEVPFEGIGWVPFDPTPPEDQTLRTQVPEPKPRPTPEVLQPPEPPEDPAEAPAEEFTETEQEEQNPDNTYPWLIWVLRVGGILALILSPILALAALKALRAWRRRTRGSEETRTVAAWDELIDRARDLGVRIPDGEPRGTQAGAIDSQVWGRNAAHSESDLYRLADSLDKAVFAPEPVQAGTGRETWKQMNAISVAMARAKGWRARLGTYVSLRTLRSRWTRKEPPEKKIGVDAGVPTYATVIPGTTNPMVPGEEGGPASG